MLNGGYNEHTYPNILLIWVSTIESVINKGLVYLTSTTFLLMVNVPLTPKCEKDPDRPLY